MENTVKKTGKGKKALAFFVLAMTVAGAGYYAWSWNYYYRNAPERTGRDMIFMWHWKMYTEGMRKAYAEDTYGGDTPEETLKLFVDALKAGDVELASKYYIPEKQKEVYEQLTKSKEIQNLSKYSDHVSNFIGGKTTTATDVYFIFYTNEIKQTTYQFQFTINSLTQKWKIAAP